MIEPPAISDTFVTVCTLPTVRSVPATTRTSAAVLASTVVSDIVTAPAVPSTSIVPAVATSTPVDRPTFVEASRLTLPVPLRTSAFAIRLPSIARISALPAPFAFTASPPSSSAAVPSFSVTSPVVLSSTTSPSAPFVFRSD